VAVLVAAAGSVIVQYQIAAGRYGTPGIVDTARESMHYATTVGQTATVTLIDGTHVTLAPQTTMWVPRQFGASLRTVTLRGEAYFDVRTSRTAPFQVLTGPVITRVLGTAFDVRRYPDERVTQVAVAAGKVVVTASTVAHPSLTLVAGSAGAIADSTAIMMPSDSVARYSAWVSGMLVFHDVAAGEVLAALSRWYGYEFHVVDSTLTARVVTAEFSARSSSEALSNLKILLNAELTMDGNVITIRVAQRRQLPVKARSRHDTMNSQNREVGR